MVVIVGVGGGIARIAKLHLQIGINDRPGLRDGEKQSQRARNE